MKTLREDICKLSGERYIIEDFEEDFVSEEESLDESVIGAVAIGGAIVLAVKAIKKRIEENKRYKWVWEHNRVESQKTIDDYAKTSPGCNGVVTIVEVFKNNPGLGICVGLTTEFCKKFIDENNHLIDFDGLYSKLEVLLSKRMDKLKDAFESEEVTKNLWGQIEKVIVQVPVYAFDLYDNETSQLKKMITRVMKAAFKDTKLKKVKVNVMNNYRAKIKGADDYVKTSWGKR